MHAHTHACTHIVDKGHYVVGSYGPKSEVYEFIGPSEEAPSGMISRGTYEVHSQFSDDDKNVYLEWKWTICFTKEWAS